MICYSCKNECEDYELSEHELKLGGQVDICLECENTYEFYLDVIKRECLIDGVSYDLTSDDKKMIERERKLRLENEEEERLLDCDKSIFYFSNEPKKKPEYNHQVLKYINGFLGIEDDTEEHIQRFRFKSMIERHWHLDEWDGLTNVHIYIDTVSKEYQKVKKPEETQWRNRVRKWYAGRFECDDESLYNCTFGYSQIDNEPFGEVYVSYDFICSKSYRIKRLVEGLIKEDKYLSIIK
ncbi:hypothetical protein J8TS2_28120 [Lederbergia ruris]|uniref:Uncharacterized protein n=1 Tax=Lederbergia ruris TaxID=217495 RepID=A0ABQ4KKL1_9BACI|nr:hypothetical protein [Lederbergia ruris]GIN58493.1 hypothetical protein J8TS2_28120 [Lederbergia ruris]